MLNRSKAEAEQYIRENSKSYIGKEGKTNKEIGLELGVSYARVSQLISGMRRPSTSVAPVETALAPEAA